MYGLSLAANVVAVVSAADNVVRKLEKLRSVISEYCAKCF